MDKLSFKLEVFEGPLDLLLHLIAKNKLNINDVPLIELLDQYVEHIKAMQELDMDIASEFLEMASRLVYLKTVSLLPKHEEAELLKDELAGELLQYQLYKDASCNLEKITDGFGTFVRSAADVEFDKTYQKRHEPNIILSAYLSAIGRGQRHLPPPLTAFTKIVTKKVYAVSSKVVYVMRTLWNGRKKNMISIFESSESRSEIVATFLAVLELIKAKRVEVTEDGKDMQIKIVKERT